MARRYFLRYPPASISSEKTGVEPEPRGEDRDLRVVHAVDESHEAQRLRLIGELAHPAQAHTGDAVDEV